MPLVSLRMSQACRDPALWPILRVWCAEFWMEAAWSSFLRWLVPRAPGLQTLQFNDYDVCAQPPAEVPAIGVSDAC